MISVMKFLGPPSSGSLGSVTYARNTFGQYQRARAGRGGTPTYPVTGAVAAWQALSFDQQQAWNAWASQIVRAGSLGAQRPVSGFLRFVGAWKLGDMVGQVVTDPPAAVSDLSISSVSISLVPTQIVHIEATAAGSGLGFIQFFYSAPWASLGTQSPPGRAAYWKLGGVADMSGGPPFYFETMITPPLSVRVFGFARMVRPDWVLGPRVMAGFVEVPP